MVGLVEGVEWLLALVIPLVAVVDCFVQLARKP